MSEPSEFEVGPVHVRVRPGVHPIDGKPMDARDGVDVEGRAFLAEISTPDGFLGIVAAVTWPEGSSDLRLADFIKGPDEYRRLERAGKMSLPVVGDERVGILRVLKYSDREYAALASTSWEELDELLGGPAADLLTSHGGTTGTAGELNPAARRFIDQPAVRFGDNANSAIIGFVLTRVIPIMKGFGRPGVQVFHS